MNESEVAFLELLNSLPKVDSKKELIIGLMTTNAKMAEELLALKTGEHIPITTVAAYTSLSADIYLGGCKDMKMASLSAKTQMIEKFEKNFKNG